MAKKRTRLYSRGVAKYIRKQKAKIRRETQDVKEQKRLIEALLTSVTKNH